MKLYTSLPPRGNPLQQIIIDSWNYNEFNPITINHLTEYVGQYNNIEYKHTKDEFFKDYGKYYLPINTIFKDAKDLDCFALTNSDIEFKDVNKDAIKDLTNEGIVISNRMDYHEGMRATRYPQGIDFFAFNKKHYNLYPESKFVLGQCHFDYWLPYRAIMNDVKVFLIENEYFWHKRHKQQYSNQSWIKTAELFINQENMHTFRNRHKQVSEYVYNLIYKKAIRITI